MHLRNIHVFLKQIKLNESQFESNKQTSLKHWKKIIETQFGKNLVFTWFYKNVLFIQPDLVFLQTI